MKTYTLVCKYCNHCWKLLALDPRVEYKCSVCDGNDLKAIESKDVFGYDSNEPKEDAYIKRRN